MSIAGRLFLLGVWGFVFSCSVSADTPPRIALVEIDVVNLDDGSIGRDRVVLLRRGEIEGIFPVGVSSVPPGYDVIPATGLYLLPAYVDMSLNLGLTLTDDADEGPNAVASDLYRRGILITIVPGAPVDSARAAADSLLRMPSGPVLEAPAGEGRLRVDYVSVLNEQVPIPAQLRYIVPAQAPLVVLGANVSGSMARRVNQSAVGQGLMTLAPAANVGCGTWDMLDSGVPVLEGLGLFLLGHRFRTGFAPLYDDVDQQNVEDTPTAPHVLADALDRLEAADLDSLAKDVPEIVEKLRGREPPRLVCPELTFLEGLLDVREYGGAFLDSTMALMNAMHGMGTALAIGTGGLGAGAYFREVELMMQAGIPSLDVVRAACVKGALALGRPDPARLRAGLPADLVVIEGNPLEDPRALGRIRYVIRGGRLLRVAGESG